MSAKAWMPHKIKSLVFYSEAFEINLATSLKSAFSIWIFLALCSTAYSAWYSLTTELSIFQRPNGLVCSIQAFQSVRGNAWSNTFFHSLIAPHGKTVLSEYHTLKHICRVNSSILIVKDTDILCAQWSIFQTR